MGAAVDPKNELTVASRRRAVRGFVLRLVRDAALADDLTQDVFVRAQSAARPCRDPVAIQGWLYSIALNLVRDHYRGQKRRPLEISIDEPEAGPPSGDDVERTVLHREMSDCVLEYLRLVPSPQQEALVLHDMVGLSHREVGKVLGVSEANAKVLAHRARVLFRSILDRNCELDFSGDTVPCDRRRPEDG
jgi:RNA polymerase sigma-70 factor (ECF subfamily)